MPGPKFTLAAPPRAVRSAQAYRAPARSQRALESYSHAQPRLMDEEKQAQRGEDLPEVTRLGGEAFSLATLDPHRPWGPGPEQGCLGFRQLEASSSRSRT